MSEELELKCCDWCGKTFLRPRPPLTPLAAREAKKQCDECLSTPPPENDEPAPRRTFVAHGVQKVLNGA